MKLSKEHFDKLYSEDITKKEYDEIIGLVDERFGEVVLLIAPKITNGPNWFTYGNLDYYSESDEGYFDPNEYKDEISIGGSFNVLPEPYDSGCEGAAWIPTRWLWTDDAEILNEFKKETEEFKQKKIDKKLAAKKRREELKLKKAKFKQIIKSKLTAEELKYIKFK